MKGSKKGSRKKFMATMLSLVLALTMLFGGMANAATAYAKPTEQLPYGLTKPDKTAVWEDDTAKITLSFELKKTSNIMKTDIVLVLDVSGSMGDDDKLDSMKAAASAFIDQYFYTDSEYNDYVRIGLVAFSKNAQMIVGLTNDAADLKAGINGLAVDGGTNIQAGLHLADQMLDSSEGNKYVILLSDGEPTYSYKPLSYSNSSGLITGFDYGTSMGDGTNYLYYGSYPGHVTANVSWDFPDMFWKDSAGNQYNSSLVYDKHFYDHGFSATGKVDVNNHGLSSISEAMFLKENGIEIFTINFDASSNPNSVYVMNGVASDASHAFSTGVTGASEIFTAISAAIKTTIESCGVVVSDEIPSYFKVVTGSVLVQKEITVNAVPHSYKKLVDYDDVIIDTDNGMVVVKFFDSISGKFEITFDLAVNASADDIIAEGFDYEFGFIQDVVTNTKATLDYWQHKEKHEYTFKVPTVDIPAYSYEIVSEFEEIPDGTPVPDPDPIIGHQFLWLDTSFTLGAFLHYLDPVVTMEGIPVVFILGGPLPPPIILPEIQLYPENNVYTFGYNGFTRDIHIDAYYELEMVDYSFSTFNNGNDGSTVLLDEGEVKYSTAVPVPVTPSAIAVSGAVFKGLLTSGWPAADPVRIYTDTDFVLGYDYDTTFNVTYILVSVIDGVGGSSVVGNEVVVSGSSLAAIPTVTIPLVYQTDKYVTNLSADWDKDTSLPITDDSTFYKYLTVITKQFKVRFFDAEDVQIGATQDVIYGEAAITPTPWPEKDPEISGNVKTYFFFSGWDKDTSSVKQDLDVYPVFETEEETLYYTVIFRNWDGSILSSQFVDPGDAAVAPATPSKPSDATYYYLFAGWDRAFNNVQSDLVVTATYNQYVRSVPTAVPTATPEPTTEPTVTPTPIEIIEEGTPESAITPTAEPTATPEPTVTPVPTQEPLLEIEEDLIAESSADTLPQTGTSYEMLMYLLGAALTMSGALAFKKSKKEEPEK